MVGTPLRALCRLAANVSFLMTRPCFPGDLARSFTTPATQSRQQKKIQSRHRLMPSQNATPWIIDKWASSEGAR